METCQRQMDRAGRAEWLTSCVIPHETHVKRRLRRLGVAREELEDIVQDAYVRLLNAENVTAVRDCRSYFVRAAMSVVLTRARRANIVREEAQDQDYFAQLQSPEPGPDAQAEARQQLSRLEDAINLLGERSREVLTLRRIELLSARQTAERMRISESAVEKHLTRAMRHLASVRSQPALCPYIAANDETNTAMAITTHPSPCSEAAAAW